MFYFQCWQQPPTWIIVQSKLSLKWEVLSHWVLQKTNSDILLGIHSYTVLSAWDASRFFFILHVFISQAEYFAYAMDTFFYISWHSTWKSITASLLVCFRIYGTVVNRLQIAEQNSGRRLEEYECAKIKSWLQVQAQFNSESKVVNAK